MTYDRILSHKLYKSNYFKSTLQKCLQQEGWGGLAEGRFGSSGGHALPTATPSRPPRAIATRGTGQRVRVP